MFLEEVKREGFTAAVLKVFWLSYAMRMIGIALIKILFSVPPR